MAQWGSSKTSLNFNLLATQFLSSATKNKSSLESYIGIKLILLCGVNHYKTALQMA
jgi:hypothetical protein